MTHPMIKLASIALRGRGHAAARVRACEAAYGTAGLFFFLNQSLFVARVLRCERYDVHGNTGEDHSFEHSLSAAAAAGQSTAPKGSPLRNQRANGGPTAH